MADESKPAIEVGPSDRTTKARPSKALPTVRIAFSKQLDILRAYAVAHEASGKTVTNADISSIVKMAATTVPHANSFFGDQEVGLLQKSDGGYIPSPAVIAFNRAYAWGPETAGHKLAPALQGLWFAQALMPRLGFRPLDERDAIAVLAEACGATPDHESQLAILLSYLETAGMIVREGGQVRTRVGTSASTTPVASPEPPATTSSTTGVETAFGRPSSGDGVHLNVTINVDMKEMSNWTPERISAFFAGFAQVLAAKGALEKNAVKE